ncbi:NYN domain-containing protein [Thermoactinospora rubra]|uniref:NYN domain-containing protein n=1 Tax=Thermoactinospora rubra TaxID=1088767 RepID=UPI000A11A55B|nr:NYN domain-containing protein [Thermoactinospora rubra]
MDRCALFVDAGYLLADGAMAVHGTRHREAVSWDYPGLLQLLSNLARERTGLPLLRCYWYEATVEGRRTPEHDVLADIPGLKLRLSRIRPGRREGVDAQVHRDLMTLARNSAICDAVVVSGDEDLTQVVCDAQDLGIRVTVVHIAADNSWSVSRSLRQESDDLIEIGGGHLRPYVSLATGSAESANGHQPIGNGQAAHPPTPAITSQSTASPSLPSPSLPSAATHTPPITAAPSPAPSPNPVQPSAQSGAPSGAQPASPAQPPVQPAAPASPPRSHAAPPALPSYPSYQPEQPSAPQPTPGVSTGQFATPSSAGTYQPGAHAGGYTGPQAAPVNNAPVNNAPATGSPSTGGTATTLADAVKAAHREGHDFGESVARDAPALWLEAVLARKPRMPSDLEARLLQGSSLPIDFLLHDEVRHALRRGFWDALERARR